MMHAPIQIHDLSVFFSHKICFEDFNAQIHSGDRIAIIGRNGAGKTRLLNILQGVSEANSGEVMMPNDVVLGAVPQLIEASDSLSGGQRFQKALTQALSLDPNMLLLDEPTNHLDQQSRNNLFRLLSRYSGTLLVVSHDPELLRTCVNTLWHIDQGRVQVFSGSYDDYLREQHLQRESIERELAHLDRQRKEAHLRLMKEQERAKKSNQHGEKSIRERKWPTIVSDEKAKRAIETSGKKTKAIRHTKEALLNRLSELRVPEIIVPRFSLAAAERINTVLLSIHDGSIAYQDQAVLLEKLYLSLSSNDRMAISGRNGSGKTSLIKAILNDAKIIKTGDWLLPKPQDIGYVDQHYGNLSADLSVFESIAELQPSWSHAETRRHLNDFLFRKQEEVNQLVGQLSGGEKVRLSLAKIAALTPKLLILDEITNNLDLETREHVIQVLKDYPGAMMVISHDEDFLRRIYIEAFYPLA